MNERPAPNPIETAPAAFAVTDDRQRIDQLTADVTRLSADLANLYAIIHELVPMTDYQIALANALVRRGYLPSAAMRAALSVPVTLGTTTSSVRAEHTQGNLHSAAASRDVARGSNRTLTLVRPDR